MKEETPEDGLRKFVVKRLGRVQRNIEAEAEPVYTASEVEEDLPAFYNDTGDEPSCPCGSGINALECCM